jgi:adenylate cyclase
MQIDGAKASWLLTCAFIAAALLCGVWLGRQQALGVASSLDRLENLTLDWRFLLAGERSAPSGVVIVAIDDQTLSEATDHAPSRQMFARLVRAVSDHHPRAVALDIAFPDSKDAIVDAELADALKSTTSVVASIAVFGGTDPALVASHSGELALAPKPSEILWPTDVIRNVTKTGLANVSTDSSGIPRYVPLLFEIPDGVAPSFALAVASAAAGSETVIGPESIELAGQTANTDLGYNLPIRYYGPAGSFKQYSAATFLRGGSDVDSVRGQVVLIGITAAGAGDTFATPFDRVVPGVEIFATAISNLLTGHMLARTAETREIDEATAVGLPVAMIALMAMRRAAVGFAIAILLLALWLLGNFLAFAGGYWLGVALPMATSVPLVVAYTGARFLIERQMGGKAAAERAALAKFQSPLLLDHILKEPQFLQKPVRQDVAVMFIDLSGFTGVAEALGPEWSRDLLGDMQTLVERDVTADGGIVINYMGDGVLAVFGLPRAQADDAKRAFVAVNRVYTSVVAWLAELPPVARDRLDFRLGAHFGPAVISRLGSPRHQQITAAGDTVNAASRLLEIAKQQHCRVVVTEDLLAAAGAIAKTNIGGESGQSLTVPIRGRKNSLEVRLWSSTSGGESQS